jgi:hypothetical protein
MQIPVELAKAAVIFLQRIDLKGSEAITLANVLVALDRVISMGELEKAAQQHPRLAAVGEAAE